ncbi:proline dehydrogenase family protein [Nakamurella sp. PAMC28650]|uniref:proline dehydrogenase family protein n=1 Tax=Nakamurella sp. PAMC28650 TaxID=2762325 RepID=UPI00164E2755|nr:proline dehydrogenase family protein [Nakamurella sp. PAMC28650]
MLRKPILALSASHGVRDLMTRLPLTRAVVDRFVAGETTRNAVTAVRDLRAKGLQVTMDHLGEGTTDTDAADATVTAYLELIDELAKAGLADGAEMSVKLSAVGQSLTSTDGHEYALRSARKIADAAYGAGARMNLDMEDHTTVDSTLQILRAIREDHPDVGVAIQAMLLRTEADLHTLTSAGSRVRLVKGAYNEPSIAAHQGPEAVDRAYVRGLKILMAGDGYVMVGSHDPRMIRIAARLAADNGRGADSWEHQMLFGIRADEQLALRAQGRTVRVYVPYGSDWYGYFTRRLAERPANLLFFLRAMITRS